MSIKFKKILIMTLNTMFIIKIYKKENLRKFNNLTKQKQQQKWTLLITKYKKKNNPRK